MVLSLSMIVISMSVTLLYHVQNTQEMAIYFFKHVTDQHRARGLLAYGIAYYAEHKDIRELIQKEGAYTVELYTGILTYVVQKSGSVLLTVQNGSLNCMLSLATIDKTQQTLNYSLVRIG